MSTASAPNPNNLILLAVLGIGAYWLFSRQAMAMPYGAARPVGQGSTAAQNANGVAQLVNAGANLVGRLFGTGGSTSPAAGGAQRIYNDDTAGQPGYGWQYFTDGTAISPTGTYYYEGQPIWSPDGQVFNPPGNVSSWDAEYNAMVGL